MSELDKYFEKAKNVEPIYEEDDAKKLLYGKLSDGGIATNLYNKIKVIPMITAIITSVATIATIAFFSMYSPIEVVEQPKTKKHTSTSSVNSTIDNEKPNEKPEELNWTEEKQPTSQSNIVQLSEKEQEKNKKPKALNWTDDNKIDIKSVNSLKLTKDELSQLGIEIDAKSFKVNAFDKYTYTINQKNEKQRDYYDSEKDRDVLPTPAMVTTSTGFKTLTLFKKGNVEATVDRYKTSSKKDVELVDHKGFLLEDNWQKRFGDAPQYNMNNQSFAEYKNSLSGHKDSAAIIELMESYEELEVVVNGKKTTIDVQEILRNANAGDKELMKKIMQESFVVDNDSSDNILDFSINVKRNGEYESGESLKLNVDVDSQNNNLFNNSNLRDSLQIVNDSKMKNMINDIINSSSNSKSYTRDLLQRDSDSLEIIEIQKESMINLDTNYNDHAVYNESNNIHTLNKAVSSTTIDTIAENEYIIRSDKPMRISIPNYNPNMKVFSKENYKIIGKDTIYERDSYIRDITKPKEYTKEEKERLKKQGIKIYHIENVSTLTINNVTLQDSNIIENKNSIFESNEIDDEKLENMSFDLFKYNINELIPIEISFDGVNTDFIVWYEATDDFLTRLPKNILEKINPELLALTEQIDHCENEPIEKKDAVMDVWSGCSGAIKDMKVFPNPTTSNSNVEFELQDNRVISIAIFDLSGKLIKNVKTGMSLGKGNTKELLNLTGVSPGLYYVVVKSEKGEQALQRIIIE